MSDATPLPLPRAELAGCRWLPRLIAKLRQAERGELDPAYVKVLGAPRGVDGRFLAHFQIELSAIKAVSQQADTGIAAWFTQQPGVSPGSIAAWNTACVEFGRPGQPMEDIFTEALEKRYGHLRHLGIETVFQMLEADETGAIAPSNR